MFRHPPGTCPSVTSKYTFLPMRGRFPRCKNRLGRIIDAARRGEAARRDGRSAVSPRRLRGVEKPLGRAGELALDEGSAE